MRKLTFYDVTWALRFRNKSNDEHRADTFGEADLQEVLWEHATAVTDAANAESG